MVAAGHALAWYPASSPLPAADGRGFEITTTQGKDLVIVSAASAKTAATVKTAAIIRTG
jgi:hypothetical protein